MVANQVAVIPATGHFTHEAACRITRTAQRNRHAHTIVVDLSRAYEADTAAFAQLVLLRRSLLRDGRDLRLAGLRDRAQRLYEINRLHDVLPLLTERRELLHPAREETGDVGLPLSCKASR